MKEIKDVIHLYLGCDVLTNCGTGKLVTVHSTGADSNSPYEIILDDTYQDADSIEWVKPILRLLSDMTEERKCKLFNTLFPNDSSMNPLGKVGFVDYFLNLPDGESNRLWESYMDVMDFNAIVTTINGLRKDGFDCDDLIPSGLAIDKKTLKV